MNIKDFYRFGSKYVSSTIQAEPIMEESHGFDKVKLIEGDYAGISFPLPFKQAYGKKLQDILDTGYAALYLISDRMKSVLEDEGLTGWKTYPVQVFDKHDMEISGYHGFSIIGRCGERDESKSEIIMKQFVPNGPIVKYYKGLYVGLDTWDGSDFFLEEKTIGAIVTRKAADVLKKSKLTNIKLANLADIEISAYTVEGV
jgi:hypothetical protein